MKETTTYHVPVLYEASLEALSIRPGGVYVDATFGGGGHSRGILERLGPKGRLFAFDRDRDALNNMPDDPRLTLINHEFVHLKNFLQYFDALPVDGILADLGLSSHQIDEPERGFSFRFDAPLDMRMDADLALSAKDVLNTYEEGKIQDILSRYGEVRNARTLAKAIVQHRPIETTSELAAVAEEVLPHRTPLKKYLAPVFQALRIEVNQELEGLQQFLLQAMDVLKPSGRLVVLTYHSLEDRLVKNFFSSGNFEGRLAQDLYGNTQSPLQSVLRKPSIATEKEIALNPRARSAKLRAAEKTSTGTTEKQKQA